VYTSGKSAFPKLKEALSSGKSFEGLDLHGQLMLAQVAQEDNRSSFGAPLSMVMALETVRRSDGFQEGDPDAICLAAEKYMSMGAIEVAEPLIEQVLADFQNHPGGWFQKARLLLMKSSKAMRQASHYRILSEDADTLSAGEQYFEDLSYDEVAISQKLKQDAFEACVKAYGLLPDEKEYEQTAIQWSTDYGTLRTLRKSVRMFIVQEAGERCNPYRYDMDLHKKITARLRQMRKVKRDETQNINGSIPDDSETNQLMEQPLFSKSTDKIIVASYKELKKSTLTFQSGPKDWQLSALNFLRLLTSQEDYRLEVAEFVERLRSGYATRSGEYFGRFFEPDDPMTFRRSLLHEHLDVSMSRAEQRDLVRAVYTGWVSNVNGRRDEALLSIYDDEIRIKFAAGDYCGAYEAACMGEADGIYRRDDGHGALVIRRTAQHASLSLEGEMTGSLALTRVLEDESLKSVAENYYEDKMNEWYADDPVPFPEYLWPPDNN
ncbi:MAG: hypothetical protein P1V34_16465, partial [Alphaproteobacteria bacterium]|nr:hypothetical protein [Alphaproteobacteria bacterium]